MNNLEIILHTQRVLKYTNEQMAEFLGINRHCYQTWLSPKKPNNPKDIYAKYCMLYLDMISDKAIAKEREQVRENILKQMVQPNLRMMDSIRTLIHEETNGLFIIPMDMARKIVQRIAGGIK